MNDGRLRDFEMRTIGGPVYPSRSVAAAAQIITHKRRRTRRMREE